MKIGIIFSNELNVCPYVEKYTRILEEENVEYDYILWNRSDIKKNYPKNYLVYSEHSELYVKKYKKIGAFVRYAKYLNKLIQNNSYDKLIVLTSITAIMSFKFLIKKYKNKYIFDFRDLSFEQNYFFRYMLKKIIYNSYFTCISSPGFKEVLPENNYVIAHNFQYKHLNNNNLDYHKKNPVIKLLHIGITRGETYNKRLVDIFGNDNRFVVNIVGNGNDTESFKEYIKNFNNINVQGTYNNDDKEKYISEADMLLYYYPCGFNNNRALANKYYDGIIFKKPLVGNINTYSGRRIVSKNLGISLDLDDKQFANKLYNYYFDLNYDTYYNCAKKELDNVVEEDILYLEKIREFLS
jgi:hypothetical protein